MNWKDVARTIATSAPALASALGGPPGAIVGMAGTALAAKLGVPATPHAVAQAIASSPEAEARIAEAELEMARVYTADVQDARKSHSESFMPAFLTVLLAIMLAAAGYALFKFEIPSANRDMANIAFGALLGAFSTGISYWLGSSRGSAVKQDMLDKK